MNNWKKRVQNLSSIKDVFMNNVGIQSLEEANNWYKDFYADNYPIRDMDKAVELVRSYKEKNIRIVGDYDLDGQSSTAILLLALISEGYSVQYDIPLRFSEGFGINNRIVNEIPDDTLIITCDNGIAQVDEIANARERGLDVLVIDHHEPIVDNNEVIYPPANVIINPVAIKDSCKFDGYCGAGLCFKFARAFLENKNPELLCKLQSLAAIGTIADVMRLTDENYALVRIALSRITSPVYCPTGLYNLILAANLADKEVSSKDIGFTIAPILNSVSRLDDAGAVEAIKLLTIIEDYRSVEARELANKFIALNTRRKELQTELCVQAEKLIDEKYSSDIPIVLYLPNVQEGLLGPVAANITKKYRRPAFVLTDTPYDILKGSARSYGNYNVKEELDKVSSLLFRYGGHAGAAGISVERENLDALRKSLNQNAKDYEYSTDIMYDLDLSIEEIPGAIEELKKYAPYGEGNPEPVFKINGFKTVKDNRKNAFFTFMGKAGKSVKIFGNGVDAVNFSSADEFADMVNKNPKLKTGSVELEFIGKISNNVFNGRISRQVEYEDVKIS